MIANVNQMSNYKLIVKSHEWLELQTSSLIIKVGEVYVKIGESYPKCQSIHTFSLVCHSLPVEMNKCFSKMHSR